MNHYSQRYGLLFIFLSNDRNGHGIIFLIEPAKGESTLPHEPLNTFLVGPLEGLVEEHPDSHYIDDCVKEELQEQPYASRLAHSNPIDQVGCDKVAKL
jgi:hypothetical protein